MKPSPAIHVNGLLVLYHRPTLRKDAATVWESIDAFERHSTFKVWNLNTEHGFPRTLSSLRFSAIVLHYSLFGGSRYFLNERFRSYLEQCDTTYKIAFFQDEYRYCQKRFAFLTRYNVDCVYTLLEPEYFKATYQKNTRVPKLVHYIPGYVDDGLIEAARRCAKPDKDRTIDIGYRARPLDYYMGKGAQEKSAIATGFLQRAAGLNLKLDIVCDERKRIYGDAWYRFCAECRAFLGVEAGVSIFDLDDVAREECNKLIAGVPGISFQEVHDRLLFEWEDRIPYRTISPRHFEAAAFRVCQILFEGEYSGVLQPMIHYIPLKKDFSNFREVIRFFSDPRVRYEVTENAYRDLIASGRFSYRQFIAEFDAELVNAGLHPGPVDDANRVAALLESGALYRKARAAVLAMRFYSDMVPTPVRALVRPIVRRWLYRNGPFDLEK